MSYHALYRQYRPSRFCEVVGQEHITDVLRNQIRTGRIAHAYLCLLYTSDAADE